MRAFLHLLPVLAAQTGTATLENEDGAPWDTKGCSFVREDGTRQIMSQHMCESEYTRQWKTTTGDMRVVDLALHPGMHLLMYGPSYMRQLASPVLCYNGRAGRVRVSNLRSSRSGLLIEEEGMLVGTRRNGTHLTTLTERLGTATYHILALNASITVIINEPTFQEPPNALREMQALLSVLKFTHAVLMQPHPPCYFEWHRNRENGIVTNPCVNNSNIQPEVEWFDDLVSLFDAAHFKSPWVDVTPFPGSIHWSHFADSTKKFQNHVTLNTQDIFDRYGSCGHPTCDSHSQTHQCEYTTPSLIAISLMRILLGTQSG
eukprot:CAMPEP_0119310814 /NCGR_PEP_ID=MMETSP1333-20130426/20356_1 /TAXON_ID=418940 /ORGANISM="Scyphosphaera apsteinii, Strain RCC1455" /LENGTH=316 /DNA_ID=CAMNT_0007315065 /DNA_START=148 /DNA_END=1098 /DNA_ORIENTATION=+